MKIVTLPRILLVLILMLSVVFPAALQDVKMVLLVLVVAALLICSVKIPSQLSWSKTILSFSLMFSVIGLLWSSYGEFRGNPGASRVLTVMAIYPVLFTMVGSFWKSGDALIVQKVLLWIGIILVLSHGVYIGSSLGLDGGFYYQTIQTIYGDVANIDQGDGYFLFTLPNVSSLIFLLPFSFMGFLFSSKFSYKYLFLLLSSIVIVLLTGRRAIYLSFAVSIALIFGVIITGHLLRHRHVPKINIKRTFICAIGLIIFVALIFLTGLQNLDLVIEDIQSIFNFVSNESNLERKYQFEALMSGVQQSLIFGSGAGAAASYSRSFEQPWAYELSYVALLFQYGLLGILFYVIGVLYLSWWQIKFIFNKSIGYQSRIFVLCFFSGFLSFLVANATNPYLGKFDFMWVVFIPVMMINRFILTNEV